MARCNCAPHPSCNPSPTGPAPLNYSGNRQAPHPYVYWMSRRTVNVDAGKNVDVTLCTDEKTGDKTYTVSAKTDPTVTAHLSQLDNTVAKKADKTYVDGEIAKKADKTYVNRELAKKADKTYVDGEIAKKADKTYVNTELAKKADKTYVNTELAKKADKTYVNTELAKKADKTYADTELAKKANTADVNAALAAKVDKEEGKGLSTNDYTDADKEKLTNIIWRPASEGGDEISLVKTGEKFTWDAKQDRIDYYLDGARVEDGVLVITGSDGTEVTFDGTSAIDKIATPNGDLDIIDKRVTIPLATSVLGDTGLSGLVQGTTEEFNENGQVIRP